MVTHVFRVDLQEFLCCCCCSNSPRTDLIHEKFWPKSECCLAQIHNSDFNSMFVVQTTGCTFQYGSNFGVPLEHDKPLCWIVSNLLCLASWNTVRCQQQSDILHPYKICKIYLDLKASQFALHIVVTGNSNELDHHFPEKICLDRIENDWLSHNIVRSSRSSWGFCILVCRELCRKQSQHFPEWLQSESRSIFSEPGPMNDLWLFSNFLACTDASILLRKFLIFLSQMPFEFRQFSFDSVKAFTRKCFFDSYGFRSSVEKSCFVTRLNFSFELTRSYEVVRSWDDQHGKILPLNRSCARSSSGLRKLTKTRRRSCGQIHHRSWFGCDTSIAALQAVELTRLMHIFDKWFHSSRVKFLPFG